MFQIDIEHQNPNGFPRIDGSEDRNVWIRVQVANIHMKIDEMDAENGAPVNEQNINEIIVM